MATIATSKTRLGRNLPSGFVSKNAHCGFTLIEVLVVVAILVITTLIAFPSIGRMKDQRAQRAFTPSLRVLATQARNESIERGKTTYMSWDDGQRQVTLFEKATDNGTDTEIVNIPVPTNIDTSQFSVGDQTVGSSDWQLHFYPDGRSEGGGVEFTDGGNQIHLFVNTQGIPEISEGALPDGSTQHWSAGDYEHRQ